MKNLFFTGLILLMAFHGVASVEKDIIAKANKSYSEGFYAEAAASYQKVIDDGLESPELYYNIGNAYFKMNEFAKSILYYEKARKLDPGNDDIYFNLQVANSKIADKIEPIPELFYVRWFRAVVDLLSMDNWAKITVVSFLLALTGILFYFISGTLMLRKAGFWGGISLFFIAGICFFLAYSSYDKVVKNRNAIIMSPTVTIKSSPDEKSVDLFVLHEGAKVQLLDNIGEWYEIRIANGSVGWIQVNSFEKI